MAERGLTPVSHRHDLFCRYVVTNLSYWQAYVAAQATDIAALDRGRERILTAIAYAFNLAETWPTVRSLIETLVAYMERRGYWDAWQAILTKAIEVAQQVDDRAGEVLLLALLARLFQRQSHFEQAINCYRQTIRLARRIGERYNEARACSNLGYLYCEKSQWWRAEVLCCHALTIFEQLGSQHGQAHTENHLGILYTRQAQWDKARQHLECACSIWQAMGDDHGLVYGYDNLGRLFNELEQPDEAFAWLQKALDQAKLVGEEALAGSIHLNMGNALRLKGEFAAAKAHCWQAKAIFQRFANSLDLALTLDNLGLIYLDQKEWLDADLYLQNALQAWRDLKNNHNEIRTIIYLVEYELARGNQQRAATWLNEGEWLLSGYDPIGKYRQLHMQLNRFRRSLSSDVTDKLRRSTTNIQRNNY